MLQLATGEFWVNNHAHVVQGEDDLETRFLFYALKTVNIRGLVTGAVQPKLTQANLNSVTIPYPERLAREAIVGILGALDDALGTNESAVQAMGDENLRFIAQELLKTIRENVTI